MSQEECPGLNKRHARANDLILALFERSERRYSREWMTNAMTAQSVPCFPRTDAGRNAVANHIAKPETPLRGVVHALARRRETACAVERSREFPGAFEGANDSLIGCTWVIVDRRLWGLRDPSTPTLITLTTEAVWDAVGGPP
jgi:hypothetical protein